MLFSERRYVGWLIQAFRSAPVFGINCTTCCFAMLFANPKYWGTWQLRISYCLEENDMTVVRVKSGSLLQRPANPLAAIIQAKLGVRNLRFN
jgi:hypothetical protein